MLAQTEPCRWQGVAVQPYKEDGTLFRGVSRQTLFEGGAELPVQVRVFEVQEGGHSTLERHEHVHVVMVLSGSGRVLVGDRVHPIGEHDLVHIPSMTWHQFRPDAGTSLAFLCLVAVDRDRPQRPTDTDLDLLRARPEVADFIRT